MAVAPLANLFAYTDADPGRVAAVDAAVRASARFDVVWHPAPGWVAATRALPLGEPDGDVERAAGLAFVEGRHRALSGTTARHLAGQLLEGRYRGGGDVGVAWFGAGGRGAVARSLAGLVPFYVWSRAGSTAVATLLEDLVRFVPGELELDPLTCGLWLGLQTGFPDRRSFFRDVTVLAPGTVTDVAPGRVVQRHVSSPWPAEALPWPSPRTRADHVATFRDAVLGALDEGLPSSERSLLTLSGGLDSSLLATLAAHLGRPLAALSLVPEPGHPAEEREWLHLREIISPCGISPHITEGLSSAARLELLNGAPAVAHPVVHPALHLLSAARRETGARVLVGGEFADEVCGGTFGRPDWCSAMTPTALARSLPCRSLGRADIRSLAGWLRRRRPGREPWAEELPAFVADGVRKEYAEWRARQASALRASCAPHRHIRATLTSLEGALTMNWEVCSTMGMRRSFPFLTADVLDTIAACHPAELFGPGPKRLERQAFAGMAPDRLLKREKGGGFGATRGDGELFPAPTTPESLHPIIGDIPVRADVHQVLALAALSRFAGHTAELRP